MAKPPRPGAPPSTAEKWVDLRRGLGQRFREGPPITPEEREKMLSFVEENMPLLGLKLREAVEKNPLVGDAILRRRAFEVHRLMELQASDPDAFGRVVREQRLNFASYDLARKYKAATTDEERERTRTDLRKNLEELFQLRHENDMYRVEQLEARLRELRDALSKRQEHREEVIDRYLEKLTGEGQYLEWERPFDWAPEFRSGGRK